MVAEREDKDEDDGEQWVVQIYEVIGGRIIVILQEGVDIEMDVCRATKCDGSEVSLERLAVTRARNPSLHLQAWKSLWGDLWPF